MSEDKKWLALLDAACVVYAHLNLRIDEAIERGDPVPVFEGIADLHTALHQLGVDLPEAP